MDRKYFYYCLLSITRFSVYQGPTVANLQKMSLLYQINHCDINILIFSLFQFFLKFLMIVWAYTYSANKSCKSLSSSNSWTNFIFHKNLVAWNWHLGLFVNTSETFYKVCILTSSSIDFNKFKSTIKLLSKGKFNEIRYIFWSWQILL